MVHTPVQEVPAGTACAVITASSPFYVEKGGQVSDHGMIMIGYSSVPVTKVQAIEKAIALHCITPVALTVGQKSGVCVVDAEFRSDVMKNHTATHLLQAALIQVLGKEVKQSGSLVHPDYLRFDFTYHAPLTDEQVRLVEKIVNEKVLENIPVNITRTTYKDAVSKGVTAIFGEKYNPEDVRVIGVNSFSKELCGGTHVHATGDIGCFKITQEQALSTGQRRIVALTGRKALALFDYLFDTAKHLSVEAKVPVVEIHAVIEKQREQLKTAVTQIKKLNKELWQLRVPHWISKNLTTKNIAWQVIELADANGAQLKEVAELLQHKAPGLYCFMRS